MKLKKILNIAVIAVEFLKALSSKKGGKNERKNKRD